VGKGLLDQPAATEFAQIQHVGDAGTIGSLDGGLAIDTLVTPGADPIRSMLVQIPLWLLDCSHANVVEQLNGWCSARW
jgi:hypothetical protein